MKQRGCYCENDGDLAEVTQCADDLIRDDDRLMICSNCKAGIHLSKLTIILIVIVFVLAKWINHDAMFLLLVILIQIDFYQSDDNQFEYLTSFQRLLHV